MSAGSLSASTNSDGGAGRARARFAQLGWPLFILVAIEFILGISLGLFVTLPTSGGSLAILESNPILILHFLVAFLLLGILLRIVALAVGLGDRRAIGVGGLGLLSGVVAFLGGTAFTFGGQSAVASLVMSLGFVGVLVTALLLVSFGRGWGRGAGAEASGSRMGSDQGAAP
jgi:hypothetical protein